MRKIEIATLVDQMADMTHDSSRMAPRTLPSAATALRRSEERIALVLLAFEDMGMPPMKRVEEERRLRTNDSYYVQWCQNLHTWLDTGEKGSYFHSQ
jgi:hypothetical protein